MASSSPLASRTRQPKPAILVMGGAFSPVHSGHVAAIEAAKLHAEGDLGMQVVGAYLACAPNGYTTHKYGSCAIPASARLEMCNVVAREHPLLNETPATYGSAKQCGQAMIQANHESGTVALIVCGSDKVGKKQKPDHIYVMRSCTVRPGVIRAPAATLHVSATLVRDRLSQAQSIQDAAQQLAGEGILPPSIAEYITTHAGAFCRVLGGGGARGRGRDGGARDSFFQLDLKGRGRNDASVPQERAASQDEVEAKEDGCADDEVAMEPP